MQVFKARNIVTARQSKPSVQRTLLRNAQVRHPHIKSALRDWDAVAPALKPDQSAVPNRPLYELCKRGIDVTVALFLFLLCIPAFAVVAILIKATSPGPVLFKQRRVGRGGEEFWCYKFRTMVPNAENQLKEDAALREQYEESYKIANDPRITPFGAFLRKTSIDELPQLFNVLRNDMSLIGPRPILKPELSKYGACGDKLLTVKPGLSGLWQTSGRSNISYDERLKIDMTYIDTRCIRLDLQLLWRTAIMVLKKNGAC